MLERLHHLRHRRAWLAVAAVFLVFTASAIAYYTFFENGKGATTPVTIGTVTNDGKELTLSGTVAATITGPGQSGLITVKVKNESTQPQEIAKIVAIPVVGEPYAKNGCLASWFAVNAEGEGVFREESPATPLSIPVGESTLAEKPSLRFMEKPVNQNACSGASVTVNMTSIP